MRGAIPVGHEHWPEPPRQYQAIAIAALLLVIVFVTIL